MQHTKGLHIDKPIKVDCVDFFVVFHPVPTRSAYFFIGVFHCAMILKWDLKN